MKTREVDRSKAGFYLQKAKECENSMERAFEAGEWNACVINAVHAAISSADALCIAKLGIRNAGERHEDAVVLFLRINPESPEIKNSVRHLSELLSIKTDAEYGERLFQQKDAEMAKKHAERLFLFVKERIQK